MIMPACVMVHVGCVLNRIYNGQRAGPVILPVGITLTTLTEIERLAHCGQCYSLAGTLDCSSLSTS